MITEMSTIQKLTVLAVVVAGLLAGAVGGAASRAPAAKADAHHSGAPVLGRSGEYDFDAPQPGSYRLPPIKLAAAATVLDSAGETLDLRELFHGRISVLSFIYTRCNDPRGCPLATGMLHRLAWTAAQDPVLAEAGLQLLSLSFDPDHDTPEVMRSYAESVHHGSGSDWRFLTTGSRAALQPILRAYDQPIGTKDDALDPFGPFYHQLRVFLIDRDGRIRNIYSLGFLDPRLVLADIRTLMLEEQTRP